MHVLTYCGGKKSIWARFIKKKKKT